MKILITGGAGFIGANLASRAIKRGDQVSILDNLSRRGASWNLEWLRSNGKFEFLQEDIRDVLGMEKIFQSNRFDAVFHQAAQVAVTTSVQNPRDDFQVNAQGTLNLLEAIRASGQDPVFIFASTNKVYGTLSLFNVGEERGRYVIKELPNGVPEEAPLDFHSPYGCSKGSADQYVLDYRRIYGLRTIVFRQSCIFGPRQMGLEDQGWVAWFAICGVLGLPITIYGDGNQRRDLLYVDDLIDLYFKAVEVEPMLQKFAFNVGGGPDQTVSILETVHLLEKQMTHKFDVKYSDWRPGDQRIYVSDIRATCEAFQWKPQIDPGRGVVPLIQWIQRHRDQLSALNI